MGEEMTSKPVEVEVPITELHYVGWAKIKTNGHRCKPMSSPINNPAYWQILSNIYSNRWNKNFSRILIRIPVGKAVDFAIYVCIFLWGVQNANDFLHQWICKSLQHFSKLWYAHQFHGYFDTSNLRKWMLLITFDLQ